MVFVEPITYGIAQESILGPLLFLLYINDLGNSVNCLPCLFADDTCLLIGNSNFTLLESAMSNDVKNVSKWCKVNKLS